MKKTASSIALATLVFACASVAPAVRAEDKKLLDCSMDFSLKGWSAFYKTSKGEGTVKCTNGQTLTVEIKSEGGGLTFGKSDVKNGTGRFSGITTIDDVLGSYAYAGADAGAVKSSAAQVLTKGEVSLSLAGTGDGWNLGVDAGKFTISKPAPKK
jgi:hypothetical protein